MNPEFNPEELVLRTIAMPKDTNFNGDIFGGWVVSQMDLGGCVAARKYTDNRVVTAAIESLSFIKPVHVGDTLCCYARLVKQGRTSIQYRLAAFVTRQGFGAHEKVTEALFTFVAIDENGIPTAIENEESTINLHCLSQG